MFTGLRILCFSLIVFSVTAANAQFDRGHHGPPGWGRPRPPMPIPPPPMPPPPPRPFPPPPPPGPVAVDVYRFFHPNGDHLMTLNWNEGAAAGYNYEGPAFSLWTDDGGRGMRVPLFRCYVYGRNHFVSNDWNCQGQVREGLLGFADRQPSGWSPREVVHCSNGSDHLATADRNECYRAGYQIYEILGYVR